MKTNDITKIVLNKSYEIHNKLGPGLLESVYEAVLCKVLEREGLKVVRQRSFDFDYEGIHFSEGLRIDLLVEDEIIIELKSVQEITPVHYKQVLTYLRLMNLEVGLLINFGGATIKEGFKRVVNNYRPALSRILSDESENGLSH